MKVVAETIESERHRKDIECTLWHNGQLFSGSDDGLVKIWNKDLKLVSEFQADEGPVYQMTADTTNNQLYTSSDESIKIWKFENEKWSLKSKLEGHESYIRKLHFVDGRLFSGDEKGEVKVWRDGKVVGSCSTLEDVSDMKIRQNTIYTVRDKDVVINELDEAKGRCWTRKTLDGRAPLHIIQDKICFPDRTGMKILVHGIPGDAYPIIGKLEGHSMIINSLAGADVLFSGGWDKTVISWNLEGLCKLEEVDVVEPVTCMTYVDSEKSLFVTGASIIRLVKSS